MIGGLSDWASFFKKPGFLYAHVVIWRKGRRWERLFLALGVFTYLFLPVASLAMFWAFWNSALPYEALFSFALAATTYGAFHNALSTSVIGANVVRQYLEEGRFRPYDDYFREYVRFLENEGDRGLFPGAVRWSLALWTVYYGLMIFGISFGLLLAPTFRLATPFILAAVMAPVVFLCWLAWQLHVRAVSRNMIDGKGYRMSEYAKRAGWMPRSR